MEKETEPLPKIQRSPQRQRRVDLARELTKRFDVMPSQGMGMSEEEFIQLMEKSKREGKLDPRIKPNDDPRVIVD